MSSDRKNRATNRSADKRQNARPAGASAAASTRLALPRQPPSSRPFRIAVSDSQSLFRVSAKRLIHAAQTVLRDEDAGQAEISIAVVDDSRIHEVNREFLGHDYPTDVLSFNLVETLDCVPPSRRMHSAAPSGRRAAGRVISGEVVASAETAKRLAEQYGWTPHDELVLYLVHGLLHLCGYDDLSDRERRTMRRRETEVLALLGLVPRYDYGK